MKLLVLGGDNRYLYLLKDLISKYNENVHFVGYDKLFPVSFSINDIDVSLYDLIIFPIDGIKKDYSITANYSENIITIPKDFLINAKENCKIIAGISSTLDKMVNDLDYTLLMEDNYVKEANGILTAEGIISNIITNTNFSINNSNILILGCGNVGKPLIKVLKSMGANLKIGVNKVEDYNNFDDSFYTNDNFKNEINWADIIINTVPSLLIDKQELDIIKDNSYLVDISSYPYGFNYNYANLIKLKINLLKGLPSTTSPESAATILSLKINSIIKEV